MRILLAVHQFPPDYCAGTETLTLRTAQELQRRGHTVRVLSGGEYAPGMANSYDYSYHQVLVRRLNPPPSPCWSGIIRSYHRPDLAGLLHQALVEFRPAVVHAFHLRRLTLELVAACHRLEQPVTLTLTDYWCCCPTGQLMLPDESVCSGPDADSANCARHLAQRLVPSLGMTPLTAWRMLIGLGFFHGLRQRPRAMRKALAACGAVMVSSQAMAEVFHRNGFSDATLRIQPYGIDLDGLRDLPPRSQWRPEERPMRVAFIGTLRPAKGAHVLLAALISWAETDAAAAGQATIALPLEVNLYGSLEDDPAYVTGLEQQITRLSSMAPQVTVRLRGCFEPDQLFQVLHHQDVLVVPSLWRENSPLIVLQALAARLPLLASDVEGIHQQINPGSNGLLFPPGDAVALGSALAGLWRSPAQLDQLGRGPVAVQGIGAYVDRLEDVYRELVGERK